MGGKDKMDKKTTLFKNGYENVRKLKESDMYLIKDKECEMLYMMKEHVLNTEKAAIKCCDELKAKTQSCNQYSGHNQALLDYSCKVDSGFCSTTYIVRAFYQYISEDLANNANAHVGVAVHEKLTNGLYGGLTGLAELNLNQENYNDVRPENVGFDCKRQGLLRARSDKYGKNAREIAMNTVSKSSHFQYCSPEVYNSVVSKGSKDINEQKNDVFALGMSVLEAGIKDTVQSCYDKGGFNEAELRKYQDEFVCIYGCANTLLCDMVELCTTVCPTGRHTASELLSKVPKYIEIIAHYNNEIGKVHTVSHVQPEVHVEQTRSTIVHGDSHVHSNVVHREPVHQTSHSGSRVVHQAQPSRVVHGDSHVHHSQPSRVVHGNSHVHHSQPSRVNHGEPRVIRHEGSEVVRREPVSSTGNVVRREPVSSTGNVVRREPMVTGGQGVVRRVEGNTSHGVHSTSHMHSGNTVRRSTQGEHNVSGNIVRRVDGANGSRVVTNAPIRSDLHNVVTRVENETQGVYRSQACNIEVPKETVTTRRITDPEEIAKVKARMAKNAPRTITEELHPEVVVESKTPERVEEQFVVEGEHEEVVQLKEDIVRVESDQLEEVYEDVVYN